jgi:hypothetical protein
MSLLIDEVFMLEIRDVKYKRGLLKALNKVLWVQNDLFGRHYLACAEGREDGGSSSTEEGEVRAGSGRTCGASLGDIDEERVGSGKENVTVFETELPGDRND